MGFYELYSMNTNSIHNCSVHCVEEMTNILAYIWGASGLWMIAPNKTSLLLLILLLLLLLLLLILLLLLLL